MHRPHSLALPRSATKPNRLATQNWQRLLAGLALAIGQLIMFTFTLVGQPALSKPVESDAKQNAQARKLYLNKCAKCHKLYDPAKYSDEQWQKWMTKMISKSKLKENQAQLLSQYIERTYRLPVKTNASPDRSSLKP